MEFGPAARAAARPSARTSSSSAGSTTSRPSISTSPHLGRMANMLSGAHGQPRPQRHPRRHHDGPGAGAADRRPAPRCPSLALGIEPNELRLEDGLSMIYGSSISWVSPTKPATKEIYPARAFDLLVGDGKGRQLDRSILDAVLAGHARPAAEDQHAATARSSTSTSNRSATSRSASTAPPRRSASKAGGRRWPSPTCRARPTRSRRTCPTT